MIGALKRAMEEEEACPLDSERRVNSTGERAMTFANLSEYQSHRKCSR